MGCCALGLGARFRPILQFFKRLYSSSYLHPIVHFFKHLYSTYLRPIIKNPCLQFFITWIWSIIEFLAPITIGYFFLWILLRPDNNVPRVDAAVVTSFNLNNTTSLLDYDIAMELSFHNRKCLDAKYLDLTAVASYGGTRLGPTVDVMLPFFFVQRSKATNVVHAVFQGSAVRLGQTAADVYEKDTADGEFNVLVKVSSTFMYDLLIQKAVYYYDHECHIRFTSPRSGSASALATRCNAIAR